LKDEKLITLIKIGAFVGLFHIYERMHGARINKNT
jgi:hypothetical protein